MSKSDDISKQELAEASGSHGEVADQSNQLVTMGEDGIPRPYNPNQPTLLEQAMAARLPTDQIKEFMDLQERYEANEARKAFAVALVKCQKEMPGIVAAVELEKSGHYAKLGQINRLITPIYTKHGFSVTFGEGEAKREDEIRTVGRLMHRTGHFEDYFCDLPLDLTGAQGTINKTKIHAKGSSNSYGERYIIKRMFNLSILSEDDDANAAGGALPDRISEDDALSIEAYVAENSLNADSLMREFRIKAWSDIKQRDLDKFRTRIQKILASRK